MNTLPATLEAWRAFEPSRATVDPCVLCAPLGATVAACGLRGAVPILHGAQGCATYIRRYLISHFREPVDIASSSLGEKETVLGGEANLARALDNVAKQYRPELAVVATTCLAETIGEDVAGQLGRYRLQSGPSMPIVHVSTPSYRDGHVEGFHATVLAVVRALACERGAEARTANVLPPLLSPADLRHLREIIGGFGLGATILPDYADRLDGVIRERYEALPEGGVPVASVAAMPRSLVTFDFTLTGAAPRASEVLARRGCSPSLLGLPVGIRATDAFLEPLARVSGEPAPAWLGAERGRLLDAYADGHKYVFGKRVALFGDPELVTALALWLLEVGAKPVVCATGARNQALSQALGELPRGSVDEVLDDADLTSIREACRRTNAELLLGSSKGYRAARDLGVPLLRIGFPIHDRIGAGRLIHVGYRGTLQLFDALVNTLLAAQQERSPVGFSYL